ncbi:response regulator [Geomonas sp. Red32]|uniref:response regulator n=1 Tax=Geomonas sp. Red32 TaxID=2912856 RepID=UPI00202CDFA6|nr:response regulator [Geomonas sp. Red32]MCM0083848.1 response regulator [Geomonas sp. Red32]
MNPAASYSVLVADDNALIRNILTDLLKAMGFAVTEAEDGQEALQLYRANRFHIIITDWVMPNMTGLELCEAVRADTARLAATGYTYIIMLTSQDSKNDLIAALTAGADEYLTKPVHKPELQARIRTAMRIIELEGIREAHVQQLQTASLIDVLTCVHNRKFMEERLLMEIKRANRYQRPLSVMVVGFHQLEAFRKGHGIFVTEKLLQATASVLKDSVRQEIDWVARWYDYQFMVLLPETDVEGASTMAKRLKLRLNQQVIEFNDQQFKVVSLFGIVGYNGQQDRQDVSVEVMVELAQKALENAGTDTQVAGIKLN